METSTLRLALIGLDANIADLMHLSVRFRWPDTGILTANDMSGVIALVAGENPDILVFQPNPKSLPLTEVITEIRQLSDVPLLVLGRIGAETEAVKALELGADDYAAPGAGYMEMTARIVSILRRFRGHSVLQEKDIMSIGPMTINRATNRVSIRNQWLSLTSTESRLLSLLVKNRGTVLSHEVLARAIWGDYLDGGDLLKKYVQRLRRKLGDDSRNPQWIVNVHGIGYRFVVADSAEAVVSAT